MNSLVMEPDAARDVWEAQDWYEARRTGLGWQFAEDLSRAIELILRHPLVYRVVRRDARRALLGRFPYAVLFVVRNDMIHVIGVMHTARDAKASDRRADKFGL